MKTLFLLIASVMIASGSPPQKQPTFTPPGGTYVSDPVTHRRSVQIYNRDASLIGYSVDNGLTWQWAAGPSYTVMLPEGVTTLKAGYIINSEVKSNTYTINPPAGSSPTPTPTPSPSPTPFSKTGTLYWEPKPVGDSASGYIVLKGKASGQYTEERDVGFVNNAQVTMTEATTYFFAVKAYNTAGLQSLPSAEASYDASGALH